MPLIKNGHVTDDPWYSLREDEVVPGGRNVIVPLEFWQTAKETLLSHGGRLGIRLGADQPPHLIADDLNHFDLIALEFPVFKDGRAFSHARLLRERYGFKGELRAVGDVLRDQLLFMVRCGFDAFEMGGDMTPDLWHEVLSELTVFYQSTGDGRPTIYALRHAVRAAAQ